MYNRKAFNILENYLKERPLKIQGASEEENMKKLFRKKESIA